MIKIIMTEHARKYGIRGPCNIITGCGITVATVVVCIGDKVDTEEE